MSTRKATLRSFAEQAEAEPTTSKQALACCTDACRSSASQGDLRDLKNLAKQEDGSAHVVIRGTHA
jgi:hypothetical protein